jgi:dCMP deaminase
MKQFFPLQQKFIDAHMSAAGVYARLSSAKRLQVGCVIVKDNTIIGIGYNGMPSGWTNDCEAVIQHSDDTTELVSKPEVLHAESNSIAKVAKSTNSTENADMFVTCAPCLECSKLIHQAGIRRVFFGHTYRNNDGLDFLRKCGVEVTQIGENNVV